MKDKYDEATEYLTEHPEKILSTWQLSFPLNAGNCLFQFVTHTGDASASYGCLTTIKNNYAEAYTKKFTDEIRADERIPSNPTDITLDNLHIFAEWQRRIDKELNRGN